MSLVFSLENVTKERDQLRIALEEAYDEIRKRDLRIAQIEAGQIIGKTAESSAPIADAEVAGTLRRLGCDDGPMSLAAMLLLRDEFQAEFDAIGVSGSSVAAGSSMHALQVNLVRSEMPEPASVFEFPGTTYVVDPASDVAIAVNSSPSDDVSFSVQIVGDDEPSFDDALAVAEESIEFAKAAKKERDTAERRHRKLKDTFNEKVAEKAGYYKQYAKQVLFLFGWVSLCASKLLEQFLEPRLKQQQEAHDADIRRMRLQYDKEIAGLRAETAELRARFRAGVNEHHLSKTHEMERKKAQRMMTDLQNKVIGVPVADRGSGLICLCMLGR